jgi:hypothetical protein
MSGLRNGCPYGEHSFYGFSTDLLRDVHSIVGVAYAAFFGILLVRACRSAGVCVYETAPIL